MGSCSWVKSTNQPRNIMNLRLMLSGLHAEPNTGFPERDIMLTVMRRAFLDYGSEDLSIQKESREWVENMSGSFGLCAWAWNKTPEVAQSDLLMAFNEVDRRRTNGIV